jgi:hypothetical protein
MLSFALVGILLRRYMKVVITSAQKQGGRFQSHNITHVPFVVTPTKSFSDFI